MAEQKRDYYEVLGVDEGRLGGRDQKGLPEAGQAVPPGPAPRRQGLPRRSSRRSTRPTRCCPTRTSARSMTSTAMRAFDPSSGASAGSAAASAALADLRLRRLWGYLRRFFGGGFGGGGAASAQRPAQRGDNLRARRSPSALRRRPSAARRRSTSAVVRAVPGLPRHRLRPRHDAGGLPGLPRHRQRPHHAAHPLRHGAATSGPCPKCGGHGQDHPPALPDLQAAAVNVRQQPQAQRQHPRRHRRRPDHIHAGPGQRRQRRRPGGRPADHGLRPPARDSSSATAPPSSRAPNVTLCPGGARRGASRSRRIDGKVQAHHPRGHPARDARSGSAARAYPSCDGSGRGDQYVTVNVVRCPRT